MPPRKAVHQRGNDQRRAGGNLTITQSGTGASFTNTGTINVASGLVLAISGGVFNQNAGSISGAAGTLSLSNTTAGFGTNFNTATAALTVTSSTLNGPGTLTNGAGQMLTLSGDTINAPLVNQGTLLVPAGPGSSINGAFSNAAGGTLRVQSDNNAGSITLTVAQGLTNAGTIDLTQINGGNGDTAALTVTAGTLVNTGTISSFSRYRRPPYPHGANRQPGDWNYYRQPAPDDQCRRGAVHQRGNDQRRWRQPDHFPVGHRSIVHQHWYNDHRQRPCPGDQRGRLQPERRGSIGSAPARSA